MNINTFIDNLQISRQAFLILGVNMLLLMILGRRLRIFVVLIYAAI